MKTNADFIIRDIVGETILVPTGNASQSINGLISLNDAAEFIWRHIDLVKDRESLVQAVLDEYEVDEETAQRDVNDLLKALGEIGMIEL